jgi:hypothetical protein
MNKLEIDYKNCSRIVISIDWQYRIHGAAVTVDIYDKNNNLIDNIDLIDYEGNDFYDRICDGCGHKPIYLKDVLPYFDIEALKENNINIYDGYDTNNAIMKLDDEL